MKYRRSFKVIMLGICSSALLFGCGKDTLGQSASKSVEQTWSKKEINKLINKNVSYGKTDTYKNWKQADVTTIKLKGSTVSVTGKRKENVSYKNGILSIKSEGTYVLSGKLENGQVQVNATDKDKVRIVLNNASIHAADRSAIFVKNADKTIISLPEDTKNSLTDGKNYADSISEEQTAALFSKDDLTINGEGSLTVKGLHNDGITSRDDIHITGGSIHIQSQDDGIVGHDSIAVKAGKLTVKSGGDAIKSTNTSDKAKGFIALQGGSYNLTSGKDGIQAETAMWITAGDFQIKSGGGSPEQVMTDEKLPGRMENQSPDTTDQEKKKDGKGIKAGTQLAIGGGTITVDGADDAVHSNDTVAFTGGKLRIETGDDGIHADKTVDISGGNINIKKSAEGIEGETINISNGQISVKASDDGINATSGKTTEEKGGQQSPEKTGSAQLDISGGNVYVNAQGDGLDANGSISMSAGTVIVNGPTNGGNGALDYDGEFIINGGTLIAAGSSGMAQAVSDTSKQHTIMMTFPEVQKAGTLTHLEDVNGEEVMSISPSKEYQTIVISTPQLKKGEYTLYSGGKHTGKAVNGLYKSGKYTEGDKVVSFKLSDTVTYLNEKGVTTAPAEGMGMHGGQPGNGGPPPEGDKGGMFGNLDEATREKVQAIMEKERSGSMTHEEAQSALKDLGIEMPEIPDKQ